MKKFKMISILLLCMVLLIGSMPVHAATAYKSYIYDIDQWAVEAPDAYVPETIINSKTIGTVYLGEETPLDGPTDVFIDKDMKIYIADPKNNRIVICSPKGEYEFQISSFINMWGVPDQLAESKGVFVNEMEIYVADTEKNRIVVFDKQGNHLRIIEQPASDVFPEGAVYKPIALVVDEAARMYVVSSTTNQGVISMNAAGEFLGFVGAQKSVVDPFMIFWRNFQTKEQRQASLRNVATEFNNITIDDEGFIYVTTSSIDPIQQQAAIMDKSSDYAPVKRLNAQGVDILRRSGFAGPGGEIAAFVSGPGEEPKGASKIIDVALGPEGTWSIIDENRQKVYTYDEDGRLLNIFCDYGSQFGNIMSIQAIVYQDTKILLLDKTTSNITVFKRTKYGDILAGALANQRARLYDKSVEDWKEILKRNNNFDLAYIGIGRSLHRDGDFEGAMQQFEYAYDLKNYSGSFKEYRREWIEKYVLVIPLVLGLFIAGVALFMKKANKVNTRDQIREGRKLKFGSHMFYGFYIIFHPFDGFWDMKHEKRGSALAATVYLLMTCAVYIFKAVGEGYIVNPYGIYSDFIAESISIIMPVTLFVIANWCLTTLFDGEGSIKDIYMVTCYSLVPIPIFIFFGTLLTNLMILEEVPLLNMAYSVAFMWLGLLLFFGVMVIHDYSLAKNVATMLGSVVGMAFIMFIAVLFSSLLMRMVSFVNSIYIELSYRW